jgi:predicted metal-dependent peptidase
MIPWFANLLAESRFLARYPQYAAVLAQFEPLGTSEVPMMAVALHRPLDANPIVRLYVNVDYFLEHPAHFPGILLHEIHHVVFRHVSDDQFHCVTHPQMMEVAMELAANEGIQETLPSPLRWQDFQDLGIQAKQSTMHRYRLLCEAHRRGQFFVLQEDQLDAIDPGWRDRLAPEDACRQGPRILIMPSKRSLFPGRNQPRVLSSPMLDDHRPGQSAHLGDTGLGDALDRRSQDPREGTWSHRFGRGFPTDTATIQRWRLRIRQHLRGDKGGGLEQPGSGPRVAKELPRNLAWTSERCPHLAWARILRSFLRPRRVVHPSYLRPNRRFPDRIGELPGRARARPRPALLVGVDTSASITDETLGRIQQELRVLSRYARVTIAECDAAVHRVYPLRSTEQVLGGGDTDFHPLFALADASPRIFDGILHFTDGKGVWPTAPPSLPVLWVLTNDHAFDCPWGTVVRLSSS